MFENNILMLFILFVYMYIGYRMCFKSSYQRNKFEMQVHMSEQIPFFEEKMGSDTQHSKESLLVMEYEEVLELYDKRKAEFKKFEKEEIAQHNKRVLEDF